MRPNSRDQFQRQTFRSGNSRRVDRFETKEFFLIVCEGTETEVNYFESFRVPGRVLKIEGTGKNTLSLVEEAVRLKQRLNNVEFDQCWCVFDRDSFPPDNFNGAVDKAETSNFRVAFSNEAFELWFLLHFSYHEARISRKAYAGKLSKLLGEEYKKSGSYYALLLPSQGATIRNARKLMSKYGDTCRPHECCPGTTVHLLVEQLNKSTR